jgi:uncharacterized protein (UPF0254 family)
LRDILGLNQRTAQHYAERADSYIDLFVMKGVISLIGGGIQVIRTGAGVGAGMVAAVVE